MKRVGRFLTIIFVLASLTSCGGKSPVSESVLRKDIEAYIAECDAQNGGKRSGIEAFEITKRQTSAENGLDKVYIKTMIKAEDGSMQTESEFMMSYEMYNDGWHLESAQVLAETIIPLVEPTYSEEELAQCIQSSGNYTNLTNVVIYDKSLDMEQGYAMYSLTCQDVHFNMVEMLDATVGVFFINEGYGGGKWTFGGDVVINSANDSWDLAGEYSCDFSWNRSDYKFYAYGTEADQLQYQLYCRKRNGNETEWKQYRAGDLDWFSLSPYTGDSFLIRVIDPSNYMRQYCSSGYSVRYEGMDFDAMKYAALTGGSYEGAKQFAVVFIGQDSAYITANVADVNENEMEIVVKCVPISIIRTLSLTEEIVPGE